MINESKGERRYDLILVAAGAAGAVLAVESSVSAAQILIIDSGGPDDAPTIANSSIWFYNVGGPPDYHLPVNPPPRLNNRTFNMALGYVLAGSSINSMVLNTEGGAFADVFPIFKSQEDCIARANLRQQESTTYRYLRMTRLCRSDRYSPRT
jgi:choline dehydrogenase